MALQNLQTRVEDLTGSIGDTNAIKDWLNEGKREVISSLPDAMMPIISSTTSFQTTTNLSEESKILSVLRKITGSSRFQRCREIPVDMSGRVLDSDDVNYATKLDPVYYIDSGVLTVVPGGDAASDCQYQSVKFSELSLTDTTMTDMPDDAEHLVILYAAIRGLQRLMSDKSGNSDITTALTAMNTENDKVSAIMDSANTAIGKVNAIVTEADTEFDLAKAELAESDMQVDASVDTALGAITTAAGRINTAVALANDEFDKAVTATTGPLDLANDEFDKVDDLLLLGETDSEGAISTAVGAMTTELGKVDDIINTAKGKVDDYYTDIGDIDDETQLWDDTNKRFKVVRDALLQAENLIDNNIPSSGADALDVLDNEDIELVSSTLSVANQELSRASTAIAEINVIMASYKLDIEGVPSYLQTATGYISQAQGYANEVSARLSQSQAKRDEANSRIAAGNAFLSEANARVQVGSSYLSEAKASMDEAQAYVAEVNARMSQVDGYNRNVASRISLGSSYLSKASMHLQEAQGYGSEASARMANVQSYGNEVTSRLSVDNAEYQWLQSQQASLQREYERGLSLLSGGQIGGR